VIPVKKNTGTEKTGIRMIPAGINKLAQPRGSIGLQGKNNTNR
jgi:hypothetical protein